MADILAKGVKFARWLSAEMTKRVFAIKGPLPDESGWILQTASNTGFVISTVSTVSSADGSFYVLLSAYLGATEDVGQAVENILRLSLEVTDLKIDLGSLIC